VDGVLILMLAVVALVLWPIRPRARAVSVNPDDSLDRQELAIEEQEVRDLDPTQQPETGFEGDDWGPGAGKRG